LVPVPGSINMEYKVHNTEHTTLNTAKSGRGFALLFAILASSVLLSISVAIWNISLREVIFSSFGRESQIAFYAADTGAECALFWDMQSDAFSTSTGSTVINCGEGNLPPFSGGGDGSPTITVNDISLGPTQSSPCVTIKVTKKYMLEPLTLVTQIESLGHNTCDPSNPTRVERGLRVAY
jgi:hypothetical protein